MITCLYPKYDICHSPKTKKSVLPYKYREKRLFFNPVKCLEIPSGDPFYSLCLG